LTEIAVSEETESIEVQKEKEEIEVEQPEIRKIEKPPTAKIQKAEGCSHFMGYLSQRSAKEKIPEECMVCENIVQCMLKKVTG
jgi:hypothetical protein